MLVYEYRLGDGNEGCYKQFTIKLPEHADVCKVLLALVLNRYIPGSYTRRFIRKNAETDGALPKQAWLSVHEGPGRATAFGADWLCAELNLVQKADADYTLGSEFHKDDFACDKGVRALLDKALAKTE